MSVMDLNRGLDSRRARLDRTRMHTYRQSESESLESPPAGPGGGDETPVAGPQDGEESKIDFYKKQKQKTDKQNKELKEQLAAMKSQLSEFGSVKDELEAKKLAEMDENQRLAEQNKKAIEANQKLQAELAEQRAAFELASAVNEVMTAGIVGDRAQRFVAAEFLSEQKSNPDFDKEDFFSSMREESPQFFTPQGTRGVPTGGGHQAPHTPPSEEQAMLDKLKAELEQRKKSGRLDSQSKFQLMVRIKTLENKLRR